MAGLLASLLVAGGALSACVHSAVYASRANDAHPPTGNMVEVNGHGMHVFVQGEGGPPVMLIHGASANAREFSFNLAPQLEDRFHLLIPDRPGHGHSQRGPKSHLLAVQASQMAGILEQQAETPAIIVGHSFGGAVALRLALERPDLVKGLVLLAPVTHDWGDGPGTSWYNHAAAPPVAGQVFSQVAPLVGPNAAKAGMRSVFDPEPVPADYYDAAGVGLLFRPATFRANARDVVALKAQLADQQTRYGELDMPIIIFSGAQDTVLKPGLHARKLEKQARNVELIKLPGGGHMPHHHHGDAIIAAIARLASTDEQG